MPSFPAPICMSCKHFCEGLACKAFPDGIPNAILRSSYDHRKPYPGDHGIQYEPDPGSPGIRYDPFEQER